MRPASNRDPEPEPADGATALGRALGHETYYEFRAEVEDPGTGIAALLAEAGFDGPLYTAALDSAEVVFRAECEADALLDAVTAEADAGPEAEP